MKRIFATIWGNKDGEGCQIGIDSMEDLLYNTYQLSR